MLPYEQHPAPRLPAVGVQACRQVRRLNGFSFAERQWSPTHRPQAQPLPPKILTRKKSSSDRHVARETRNDLAHCAFPFDALRKAAPSEAEIGKFVEVGTKVGAEATASVPFAAVVGQRRGDKRSLETREDGTVYREISRESCAECRATTIVF